MQKFLLSFILLNIFFTISFGKNIPTDQPPVVQTAVATLQNFQPAIKAIGTLSSLNSVIIKPEISGRITQIDFKSGQDIKKDMPLVHLEENILSADLESNTANFQLKTEQFNRAKTLFNLKALSRADFDLAKANLQSAHAALEQSKAKFSQSIIKAPFDGRLGLRQVSVGDYVSIGQSIVTLQSLDPIVVDFSLSEIYLSQISKGLFVTLHSDSYPKEVFKGKIYAIDATINPQTRSISVRAKIPNPDKKLLPGAFVELSLSIGNDQQVVVIPQTALIPALDNFFVYKVVNHQAIKVPVTVLKRDDKNAMITKGLKPGDIVISAGQQKLLEDHAKVAY